MVAVSEAMTIVCTVLTRIAIASVFGGTVRLDELCLGRCAKQKKGEDGEQARQH